MKYQLAACVLAGLAMSSAHAAPPISFFPATNLGAFLAERFDLATIRSSLGPRRAAAQRTFKDMGLMPSRVAADSVTFDLPGDWFYELKIVGRRDVNGDGIEDLEACFTDQARNGGSYRASQALLITRYAPDGYALAISYSPANSTCHTGT